MPSPNVDQIELIRKILSRVCSDHDGESQLAAKKVYELLNRAGLKLADLKPPAGSIFGGAYDSGFDRDALKIQMIWASLGYSWEAYIPPKKDPWSGKSKQDPPPRRERPADFRTDSHGRTEDHRNHFSQTVYQGKNQDILESARIAHGWSSFEWAGFGEIAKAGLSIKGQKSTTIEKWGPVTDKATGEVVRDGRGRVKMFCKYIKLWNMSQVQGEYTGKNTKWKRSEQDKERAA